MVGLLKMCDAVPAPVYLALLKKALARDARICPCARKATLRDCIQSQALPSGIIRYYLYYNATSRGHTTKVVHVDA